MYHNNMTENTYSYSSIEVTWNSNTQEQLKVSATTEQEVSNLFQLMNKATASSLQQTQQATSSQKSWRNYEQLVINSLKHTNKD